MYLYMCACFFYARMNTYMCGYMCTRSHFEPIFFLNTNILVWKISALRTYISVFVFMNAYIYIHDQILSQTSLWTLILHYESLVHYEHIWLVWRWGCKLYFLYVLCIIMWVWVSWALILWVLSLGRFDLGPTDCEGRPEFKCHLDSLPCSLCGLLPFCQANSTFSKLSKASIFSPLNVILLWIFWAIGCLNSAGDNVQWTCHAISIGWKCHVVVIILAL